MMYVVRLVDVWEIMGVFDSYEKMKEYCVETYKKWVNKYGNKEFCMTEEEVLEYFEQDHGIEDFIYFDEIYLNQGVDFDFTRFL